MSTTQQTSQQTPVNQPAAKKVPPVAKFGKAAVWKKLIEDVGGGPPRELFSASLSLPRFRDPATGQWRDRPFYTLTQLCSLAYDIERAIAYMYDTQAGQDENEEAPF